MALRFLLIGDPVAHSRSPAIHRKAFEITGIEGDYAIRTVGRGGIAPTIAELREGTLDGVNITMPLKLEAFAACDLVTSDAGRSGSVNTLRCRDGSVEGHSTDIVAFREAFQLAPSGAPLLVLGAGGSARAAIAAWDGEVIVSARDQAQAEALGGAVAWGSAVADAVLVNATSLGMAGETLPPQVLESASVLIDLPYGDHTTPAVGFALARGMPVVDGLGFLAEQAAASFEWWTGTAVDSALLIDAARKA